MSKETSSTIFKKLVNSPVGIVAEFIVNKLASENGYEPLRNYFLEIQTGKTPSMSNPEYYASNDIEWIKPSDIGGNMILSAKDFISQKAIEDRKATIYKPNTVLFNCIGNLGRLGLVKKIASSNQQITGILFNDQVHPEFVYYHFLTKEDEFYKLSSQTTLPIINQKGLGNLDFTCPNVSVQKEVVRFLEYCKECLDDSKYPTNSDFELSTEIIDFTNKAFKAFYTQRSLLTEYTYQLTLLENLNQAILQEAVQGKLVPQDDNDEPASELLKRIKAEKELLIREKLIKQGKLQEAETLDELLFDIPKSWVWCKLDEICKHITDGTHQTPKYTKEGRIFLSAQNVKPFKFMPEEHKYVSEEAYQEYTKNGKPEIGDILIGRVGAGIGETAVIDKELDFCIYVSLALVQPFKTFVDSNYLAIVFNSPYGYKYAKGNISSKGGSAGNFNLGRIRSFLIPLPPLSEQKRIVSEIEKQFAKTKQLKEHIHANQQATEQLLKALLHQAFEVKKAEEINS